MVALHTTIPLYSVFIRVMFQLIILLFAAPARGLNVSFLPGDAYFPSSLESGEAAAQYDNGRLLLSYQDGQCIFEECGHSGFSSLTLTDMPAEQLEQLTWAVGEGAGLLVPRNRDNFLTSAGRWLRRGFVGMTSSDRPPGLSEDICLPAEYVVLVYPRAFDPNRAFLFNTFNEYQAEEINRYGDSAAELPDSHSQAELARLKLVPPLHPFSAESAKDSLELSWSEVSLVVFPRVVMELQIQQRFVHRIQELSPQGEVLVKKDYPNYGDMSGSGLFVLQDTLQRFHFQQGSWQPVAPKADPPDAPSAGALQATLWALAVLVGLVLLPAALLLRRRRSKVQDTD